MPERDWVAEAKDMIGSDPYADAVSGDIVRRLVAEVERLRTAAQPVVLTFYDEHGEPLLVQHVIVRPCAGIDWIADAEDLWALQRARHIRLEGGER
jgi:hypothetical protein